MGTFNVPNLDAIDRDGLEELDSVFFSLHVYADATLSAREARIAGKIDIAISWESYAQEVYSELPDWAKW